MSEYAEFNRIFLCKGVITRKENGLACAHKIKGSIVDFYWISDKEFKIGEHVDLYKIETRTGNWYIGERENVFI
jgi:hypothetical protein